MTAREVAIVKRIMQQLVEMSSETSAGDNNAAYLAVLMRLVKVIRRSEAAKADPVLIQCCEALGK